MPERLIARLATKSHSASPNGWTLSEGARRQMVEQLPGIPVTWNYDTSRSLGRVVSAEEREDGVFVSLELEEPPARLRTDEVGPGFRMIEHEARENEVLRADVREVSLLPEESSDA